MVPALCDLEEGRVPWRVGVRPSRWAISAALARGSDWGSPEAGGEGGGGVEGVGQVHMAATSFTLPAWAW